jgi:hypothetical protein
MEGQATARARPTAREAARELPATLAYTPEPMNAASDPGVAGVPSDSPSPPRSISIATWLLAGVAIIVLALGLLVAIVLPYGDFDAMAVGVWSRLIAEHWPAIHFPSTASAAYLQRPFFYFLQGTLWHVFGFHIALGRVLSFFFSGVLVGSIAWLGSRTTAEYRRFAAALAVAILLIVSYFEQGIAGGLTDVPMAAMIALTAALATMPRLGRTRLPLVAVSAFLAVLTKRSAIPALVGLGVAALLGSRTGLRQRTQTIVALVVGVGCGLLYDLSQAHYLHQSLRMFLTGGDVSGGGSAPAASSTAGSAGAAATSSGVATGNVGAFYATLANQLRKHVLLDGSWLGDDLRLFLWFAVAYAVIRLLRAGHRTAVLIALPVAAVWSWLGPHLAGAHGVRVGILATGTTLEQIAVLLLAASILFAIESPSNVVPDRLELGRLLIWAAPSVLVWAKDGVYATRLLSPAWPALVLLMTRSLVPAFAGARRRSEWLLAVPTVAVLILVAYSTYSINNLGTTGWQALRAGGISGLGNPALMRNIGYGGDFDAEYEALLPQVGKSDRILTDDGRLQFFYLDQIDVEQPQGCSQIPGHRVYVLLEDDEIRTIYGKLADPAYWEACKNLNLTKVAERPGAFAVLVNLTPQQVAAACKNLPPPPPGLAVQLGTASTSAAAETLRSRIASLGFVQATVQQLGCSSFRIVETGVPSQTVGQSIVVEAKSAGLAAKLVGG